MSKPDSVPPQHPVSGPQTLPAHKTGGLRQVTLTGATRAALNDSSEREVGIEMPARLDAYIGATIDGRYLVEKILGEGGMGVVYRCRHTIIDKLVAMKVLRADMARNEEVTERFLNEARSASSIGNPHIIDISDFGRLPDGATYFIMEYLDGQPLSAVLDEHKALPSARLLKITSQLAEGLAAAHDGGIIHRDLKPDNIFLLRRGTQTDFVKILDFGIAKASATNSKLTQAGQVFGTPHYMSPEQAAGTAVDHRSDIYAVGVMLYEMATGRLPFDAENFMAILTQHMYKAPSPFVELGLTSPVSAELESIVMKCLSKAPEDRYQTMAELSLDLHKLSAGETPASWSEQSRRPVSAHDLPDGIADRRRRDGPPSGAKSGRIIALALAGVVAMGGAFAFLQSPGPSGPATIALAPGITRAGETPGALAPAAPAADGNTPAAAPHLGLTRVALAVSPLAAHVFRGEEDLGTSPVVLDVGGEPVTLEVRHPGYETREFVVDGSDAKVSVTLEPVKRPVAAVKPSTRPAPTPAKPAPVKPAPTKPKPSSDLIVNPWD